jgi:hypothetical protein
MPDDDEGDLPVVSQQLSEAVANVLRLIREHPNIAARFSAEEIAAFERVAAWRLRQ